MTILKPIRLPNGEVYVAPSFEPQTGEDLLMCLRSWHWRIFSGKLYKIMVKDDDDPDDPGFVLPFRPNKAQAKFLDNLHYRNIILKARQLGFTTLIAILWLDHALFNADQRCAIVAHGETAAQTIFRDKVKFAYDNLPPAVRAACPLQKDTEDELLFAHNNSGIRVAISTRSGTVHRLHISELGKIAAAFPKRANEVKTGSLPSVPARGIVVVESTSEGAEGYFYELAKRAQDLAEARANLTDRQFRFHFFPWHEADEYTMDPEGVSISPKDHQYFDELEHQLGKKITMGQRAWYVSVRDEDFAGDGEMMWQEYPSTPDECWQKSTEGTFFAIQMGAARQSGRIIDFPILRHVPVFTWWDIGNSDGTAIWLGQHIDGYMQWVGYIEGWGRPYRYFVDELHATQLLIRGLFLPHDAAHQRQQADRIASPQDMLAEIVPSEWRIHIVPRTHDKLAAINLTRQRLSECKWHATNTKEGLIHLNQYRKKWNTAQGAWSSEPNKLDGHSEGADAIMGWAQTETSLYSYAPPSKRKRKRASGAAA
ncbi:hypothetical protein [Maritimibacter sp. DP1N21-5]|uniref:hypothetical protein n=1 Tax=Maritimibacter sp. DP1N21-5 TaxID=2836867 RepID=UPI001C442E88|nr:hypothetical protein [Maritimibacter sp. DP1N21-5]MBV7408757.1 hypothetical protein [Maritimibacter sp. DP1N21-5]